MGVKQQEHIPAAMVEVAINYKLWLVRREDAVLLLRRVGAGEAVLGRVVWPARGCGHGAFVESGRCARCAPQGHSLAPRGAGKTAPGVNGAGFGRISRTLDPLLSSRVDHPLAATRGADPGAGRGVAGSGGA
jgi:hypothetical protein